MHFFHLYWSHKQTSVSPPLAVGLQNCPPPKSWPIDENCIHGSGQLSGILPGPIAWAMTWANEIGPDCKSQQRIQRWEGANTTILTGGVYYHSHLAQQRSSAGSKSSGGRHVSKALVLAPCQLPILVDSRRCMQCIYCYQLLTKVKRICRKTKNPYLFGKYVRV